jgi:protein TonB
MTSLSSSATPYTALPNWSNGRRPGPLVVIVLLHLGLFYALQNGLIRQATQSLPHEVFATLIASPVTQIEQPSSPKTLAPKSKPMPRESLTPAPLPTPIAEPAVTAVPQSSTPSTPSAISAPVAPVETPAPTPKTLSSGVEYLQQPRPEYPAISRRQREEGVVTLRVLVNENGRPEQVDLQLSSGSARLDEAARQAVLRALFKPHKEDGKTVAVYAIVPIRFQLDN